MQDTVLPAFDNAPAGYSMLDCHANNQQAANYCFGNLDLATFHKGPPTYIELHQRPSDKSAACRWMTRCAAYRHYRRCPTGDFHCDVAT
ncbi:MAG: hypothetical protein ACYCZD_12345 [Rhodanobacter sp.]